MEVNLSRHLSLTQVSSCGMLGGPELAASLLQLLTMAPAKAANPPFFITQVLTNKNQTHLIQTTLFVITRKESVTEAMFEQRSNLFACNLSI